MSKKKPPVIRVAQAIATVVSAVVKSAKESADEKQWKKRKEWNG